MKTNWKALVNKTNASLYAIPNGWLPKEELSKLLDCSPEKLNETLRAGLQLKRVEQKQFAVWSPELSRKIMVQCYREVSAKDDEGEPLETIGKAGGVWSKAEIDKARKMAAAGKSYRQISEALGRTRSAVKGWFSKNHQ